MKLLPISVTSILINQTHGQSIGLFLNEQYRPPRHVRKAYVLKKTRGINSFSRHVDVAIKALFVKRLFNIYTILIESRQENELQHCFRTAQAI
jgi:hypothetical protein